LLERRCTSRLADENCECPGDVVGAVTVLDAGLCEARVLEDTDGVTQR
jgi:hypothetical protein